MPPKLTGLAPRCLKKLCVIFFFTMDAIAAIATFTVVKPL
jgi:hypothetical protein